MRRSFLCGVIALAMMMLTGCGYNTIQQNDEAVKAAWGDVEASYQRRNDLVPNLVETVKAYAKHESETLRAVTEARARWEAFSIEGHDQQSPGHGQFSRHSRRWAGPCRGSFSLPRTIQISRPAKFPRPSEPAGGHENRINVARTRYNKPYRHSTLHPGLPEQPDEHVHSQASPEGTLQAEAGAEKAPR